ncbi:tetratricopeptide repeat protein [Mariniradius sediminis]|uniref:Tetratricopeptide repeat protein n=1 Tax=Mariniradius sediminis TaxID=2909237 RepID=A0ABS9BRX7_9BACT|nr:tetratricopeptide repeat protein [Mariniradius sediminis]MCF1750820.1 tetratricopeptide repeat protein [Mariniradius sediminis]
MYRRLIFIALLAIPWAFVQAQQSLPQVDAKTYELFQQGAWDRLIEEGNKAIQQGIDFYYLRVRIGIAHYEKRNYHAAIRHFEKARELNDSESYVQEYLYFANLFSGRSAEAKVIAEGFDPVLKSKTGTEKLPVVSRLDLAYNFTGQIDPSVIQDFNPNAPIGMEGSQFIPDYHHYYFGGLGLDLSPRFSIYQGYSYLQVSHLLYSQSANEQILDKTFASSVHQYYVAANLLIGKGLTLLGGLHFVRRIFPVTSTITSGPPGPSVESTVISNAGENDLTGFVSLYKRLNRVTIGASYYRGSLGNFTQNQADGKVIIFPFGNLNLYTASTASLHQQDFGGGNNSANFVFDQQIGLKTTRWLWVEGYGTFGNMNNFFMNDGLLVFNRMDTIKQRLGGRLLILPSSNLKLTLDYTLFQNQSEFFPVSAGENLNTQTYNTQAITGIITWTF